jgi:hypothetical protein
MVAKATLTLPAQLLASLRERSQQEGLSLNETAVQAIERGLGGAAAEEGWRALGALVEVPPTLRYDADAMRQLRVGLGPSSHGLEEDLDWARGA